MKVHLHSIGCRLNQSEIETMARQLAAAGHDLVSDVADADQIILNTCAVTAAAARDTRNLTRRFHRANEQAAITLTGCYATIAPETLAELPGVTAIVANAEKDKLVGRIDPTIATDIPVFDQPPLQREYVPGSLGRTRAFVKVQDGCDNRCTFCITTIARGEGRSRHLADVVAEIQALTGTGYQEAVLTGVHLGSYGRDLGHESGLFELVQAILDHTDISRLRLSSLEPWDLAEGFFHLWQNPRLMPHLHLPLQSGDDYILRRMARRTSRAEFRALAAAARAQIPDLGLSTDMIVGFPGETEREFANSLDYVAELGFSRLHVFGYSPRPETAAARMPGQVAGKVKKERVRQMIALGQEQSLAFHRQHEGQTRKVLWEAAVGANGDGLRWSGYTDNYIRVTATGSADLMNHVSPVTLSDARAKGMEGVIEQEKKPQVT